jgi:hypothetical protein
MSEVGNSSGNNAKRTPSASFCVAPEPRDVVLLDAHVKRLGEPRHLLADIAEPDDAEHFVLERTEHDRSEIVAPPPPGDDILMLPDESPRHRQHQQ